MSINRDQLRTLVKKYSGQGPRYTSYPSAVEFAPTVNNESWERFLQREFSYAMPGKTGLSLYVHIPFCSSLCYFCACHKLIVKDRGIVPPYLEALKRDLQCYRRVLPKDSVIEQLHWGGGSPSYLSSAEAESLFESIRELFPLESPLSDISIEVDPRTADRDKIRRYRALGFNRLSLGVQDFDLRVQEAVNRVQPYEMTAEIIEAARQVKFSSINVDLIYGLPEQTRESFAETLRKVLALRPDRIALYGYAHVSWLKKSQNSFNRLMLPSPEARIELFLLALDAFAAAGYVHIGMDHFALPEDSLAVAAKTGGLHRSFMGYTTHRGSRLMAIGASGISCFPGAIAQNIKDVKEYTLSANAQCFSIERGVIKTTDDLQRAEVIDSLFCRGEIDTEEFQSHWQLNFWEKFSAIKPALIELEDDGLVSLSPHRIELSASGRLFTRNVAMLFDAYLPGRLNETRRVFSATV